MQSLSCARKALSIAGMCILHSTTSPLTLLRTDCFAPTLSPLHHSHITMPQQRHNDSSHRRRRSLSLKAMMGTSILIYCLGLHCAFSEFPRPRLSLKPKDMRRFWNFSKANGMFSDTVFALANWMQRETFEKLLQLVYHRLTKNEDMAKRAGCGLVSPEARLGILLLVMGGESVHGCMAHFEVGRSTVFQVFKEKRDVLNTVLSRTAHWIYTDDVWRGYSGICNFWHVRGRICKPMACKCPDTRHSEWHFCS